MSYRHDRDPSGSTSTFDNWGGSGSYSGSGANSPMIQRSPPRNTPSLFYASVRDEHPLRLRNSFTQPEQNSTSGPIEPQMTSVLDYDDASGRYSFATPPRSNSITSSAELVAPALSRNYNLLPVNDSLYSFERQRFTPHEDDSLHEDRRTFTTVGRSRYIVEPSGFKGGAVWSWRGIVNGGSAVLLLTGIIALFAGYPIIATFASRAAPVIASGYVASTPTPNNSSSTPGGVNITNDNAPNISTRGLIDPDTPQSAMTKIGTSGEELVLVFSDEFNTAGRTFYPGDDPYWEAVNLHYWQTEDLEWYDPGNVITEDGYLAISLTKETLSDSHGLGYLGGMLQSWNKFCFTQGRIEVATSLPGSNLISGLWPAAWIMGNLGRAGYGASLEGLWPYSYESCDIGTLPNQTSPTGGPAFLTTQGLPQYNFDLSYLPGQRLSACTCPGEPHPGPVLSDGSFRGRSASEIDIFEATASPTLGGMISQSAQWGPMNPNYYFVNATTADVEYYTSPYDTIPNTYLGGAYQQSTSALSSTNPATYDSKTNFAMYGLEYTPSHLAGAGKGNVSWLQEDESMWTLHEAAMAGNTDAMIGTRVITGEPMSIILNLGMSESFGNVSLNELVFPAVMRIDYVRVYQPKGQTNVGCDPVDYPTSNYIQDHLAAYSNQNLTTWAQYDNSVFPKNRLTSTC